MLRKIGRVALVAALAGAAAIQSPAADAPAAGDKFEAAVKRFEEKDQATPPPKGAVLFYGSSSIAGWNTAKHFPDRVTVNRGIGGTTIADAVRYAERIAIPYAPKAVVFYAGDNDIAGKKTPKQVCEDFQALVKKLQAALPKTRILFLSIKPSVSRWALWPKMQEANALVAEVCKADKRLTYLDIAPVILGADGQPKKELFKPDGLHLNEDGYKLWAVEVEKALGKDP